MFDRILARAVTRMIRERKRVVFMPYGEAIPQQIIQSYGLQSYLVMLNDQARISGYEKVIQKKVKDKIVLEIGPGAHAPLARACVRAGAKKVYAIEANPTAYRAAKKLIQKDGLGSKIELIFGYSTDVTLPEKAEVLVQDMIGNIGSSEGMASFMVDAKKRLLMDNAIFIPERVQSFIVPVQKPIEETPWLMRWSNVLFWWANPPKKMAIMNFPQSYFLSTPDLFEDFVFDQPISLTPQHSYEFLVKSEKKFSGFLIWIKVQFDETTILECLNGTSWCSVLILLPEELPCKIGDKIVLDAKSDLSVAPKYYFNAKWVQGVKTKAFEEISC